MSVIERRSTDPGKRLGRRLSELTALLYPEDQDASHVLSYRVSLGGVSTDWQKRQSIGVVNKAIAAIKGANRFIDSGGLVESGKVEWRRPLPSDDPNDCVEFTVILR